MPNMKEQLNKAFDSSANSSTLVHLSSEEASAFVDTIMDESTLSKKTRVVKMDRATMKIGKLIGNGRFLHAGGRDVEVTTNKDKFTPDFVQLSTKEIIGAIDIYDDELKHNIEGQALETRLLGLIAKKIGNELEEIGLYSDTAGTWGATESAFDLFDGWLKKMLAGGNVIDASNVMFSDAKVSKEKFVKLIKAMPTKFRRDLQIFAHNDIIIDYNTLFDSNFNRNTFIDNVLGTPLNSVPNMRFNVTDETDVILTNPLNLITGIQIEDASMSFEKERVAKLRKTTYHFQMEVDFAVEEVQATGVLKKLKQLV